MYYLQLASNESLWVIDTQVSILGKEVVLGNKSLRKVFSSEWDAGNTVRKSIPSGDFYIIDNCGFAIGLVGREMEEK